MLWVLFWPLLWYLKIGDITGEKSWFWIVGELNYPFALLMFYVIDGMLSRVFKKPWVLFLGSVLLVSCVMPFFYQRVGFSMGVLMEAVLF